MELISPQLVSDASELPAIILVLAAAVGPIFWALGWKVHRALFVAAATVVGGVYGLMHGSALGLFPVVAAALLSLSAGGLALAVLRVGVFIVAGAVVDLAACAAIRPYLDANAQVWLRAAAFLIGGISSLVFYRLLVVSLTSFVGSYLLVLGGLAFAARQGEFDTVALAEERPWIVTTALVGLGLAGAAAQYLAQRHRAHEKRSLDPTSELIRKIMKTKSAA